MIVALARDDRAIGLALGRIVGDVLRDAGDRKILAAILAQQADGVGRIVAQVGKLIGPCGFSSLAATREWLRTGMAKAFMRAYRKTRVYMNQASAGEIARAQKPYFPDIDEKVLAECIATYQKLGCWTPHVEITRAAYEKTLDIFEYNGLVKQRYPYEMVCAEPPAG